MKKLFYLIVINIFLNYVSGDADRIKGGTLVKKGQYPYFVQIAIGTNIKTNGEGGEIRGYACTGSLIHPFWVLTAAHCFKKVKLIKLYFESNYIIALMGTENINNFTNAALVRFIEKVYIHPYYKYEELVFDIDVQYNVAVAVLKQPFVLNEFIQTIRLPDSTTRLCTYGVTIGEKPVKVGSLTYKRPVAYTKVRPKCSEDLGEPPVFHGTTVFYSEVKWYKGSPLVGEEGGLFICYQEYEPIQYGIVSTYYNSTEDQTAITIYENVESHMQFIKRLVPFKPAYKVVKLVNNEEE